MKHSFKPSQLDVAVCVECKRPYSDHRSNATCEGCGKEADCEIYHYRVNGRTGLYCKECFQAEEIAEAQAYQSPALQQERLNNHKQAQSSRQSLSIPEIKQIDLQAGLSRELFNAATIAHVEAMKVIDADPSVTNKDYAKCQFLVERIEHFDKLLFELKEAQVKTDNVIAAGHVLLSQLSNNLRAEEREKLRIKDRTYPKPPTKTPKPKAVKAVSPKAPKPKYNYEESNKWAGRIGLPETVIHMRMLAMNMTAEAAARTLASEMGIELKEGN